MSKRIFISALIAALGGSGSLFADAIPYPSPGTVAPAMSFTAMSTGELVGYFYGSTADFEEQLGVLVNGQQLGSWALDNKTSSQGDSIDFGPVTAGDKLVFALNVLSTSSTYYSDPSMNSDGMNHAYSTGFSGNGVIPAGTYIGFEDADGNSSYVDWNYNDETMVFQNVAAGSMDPSSATPEPSSLALLATGFSGVLIGLFRKRKNAK